MSDLNDTTAANNEEETVSLTYPVRIITAIGKGTTADEANINGATAFEDQMAAYNDAITGNVVVINSGCNVLYHSEENFEIQYWAMVRINP